MRTRAKISLVILLLLITAALLFFLSNSDGSPKSIRAAWTTGDIDIKDADNDTVIDAGEPHDFAVDGNSVIEIDTDEHLIMARQIVISEVELNQGVGILLVDEGKTIAFNDRVAPVIARRPALVRIFWKTDISFEPKAIKAVLGIRAPGASVSLYEQTKLIEGDPTWNTLNGSFNWEIEKEDLLPGTTLEAILYEESNRELPNEVPSPAPSTGKIDLNIADAEMRLNVTIVPATMSCTPSSALNISPRKKDILKAEIFNMFPLSSLTLDFHEPQVFDLTRCGDGIEILAELARLRDSDGAPPTTIYHAIFPFQDTPHFEEDYTSGYAVWYDSPGLGDERVSYSVAFVNDWINSVTHEIGHTLGRPHTFEDPTYEPSHMAGRPCGRRSTWGWGIESSPHSSFDFLGYNELSDMNDWLIPPTDDLGLDKECFDFKDSVALNDFMSYAYPYWVSAYTYSRLVDAITLLNSLNVDENENSRLIFEFENVSSLHGFFDENLQKGTWVLLRGHPSSDTLLDDENHATFTMTDDQVLTIPIVQKRAGSKGEVIGTVIPLPRELDLEEVESISILQEGKTLMLDTDILATHNQRQKLFSKPPT